MTSAASEPFPFYGTRLNRGLTEQEKDVLIFVSEGVSTREIAEAMGISPHTARNHVQRINAKLETKTRAHAVATAIRNGDIE